MESKENWAYLPRRLEGMIKAAALVLVIIPSIRFVWRKEMEIEGCVG